MTLEVTLLKIRPDGSGYDVIKTKILSKPGTMRRFNIGRRQVQVWLQSSRMIGVVNPRGLDAQIRQGEVIEKTDAMTITTQDGRIIELTPPNKISPLLVVEQKS